MTGQQLQQLIRAGLLGVRGQAVVQPAALAAAFSSQASQGRGAMQQALDMAALARQQQQHLQQQLQQREQQQQQQQQQQQSQKTFPGRLTQIKEFPVEKSNQQPYKLQKALIDQKIVPCINVRPYVFHDLMMSLPDFVKHFFPDLPLEKSREMLQEILKVVLYKGNT